MNIIKKERLIALALVFAMLITVASLHFTSSR